MPTPDDTDVTATLTDLERKLVDLERELGSLAGGAAAATTAAPEPPKPSAEASPGASLRVEELRSEVADLMRFRDRLEATARELIGEYDRLVARLQGGTEETVAEEPAVPDDPGAHGEPLFTGSVVVEAGPFGGITALQDFKQALERVDGAEDVRVRSFDGTHALIDLRLADSVPLVRLLREQLSVPMTAHQDGEGRLTVDMTAGPPTT